MCKFKELNEIIVKHEIVNMIRKKKLWHTSNTLTQYQFNTFSLFSWPLVEITDSLSFA